MAQAKAGRKKGKKGRKIGRNKVTCERYRKEGRREKNKARRIRKHLKRCPNDAAASAALSALR